MIIRINAQGKVVVVCGGVLMQGSTVGNDIYFEAPITAAAACHVYFTLPNGKHVGPFYATSSHQDHELGLNTWHLSVDAAITQYAGELNVHADFMQGSDVVATADCYTTVRRGPYRPSLVLPDNAEQYLEAFSKAYADGANAFLNLLTIIGAESARLMYAWKRDGYGDFVYTTSRNPAVGDTTYYFSSASGSFIALDSNAAVVDGDIIKRYDTTGNLMVYRYSEGDNRVEIVENKNAANGTILKRIYDTVSIYDRASFDAYGNYYGIVRGGTYKGVTIEDGRVGLDNTLTGDNFRNLRSNPTVVMLTKNACKDKPITFETVGDAVQLAPVPVKEENDTGVYSPGYEYYLGIKEQLDLSFSSGALLGDRIFIQWVSGNKPTTLTIDSSNTNDLDFTPAAYHVCEIQGVYGIIGYSFARLEVIYGWNLVARQSPMEVT